MCEPPSDTSDEQRFDEMFIHLTPRGATIPFGLCYDSQDNLWVATKGGLFKFDPKTRKTLWERKNIFPKKMAPFPQVFFHKKQNQGEILNESFIDGLLVSMTISEEGEIFITKKLNPGECKNTIFTTSIDAPIGWDEVISSDKGEAFFAICSMSEDILVAAVSSLPAHMNAAQKLVYIDIPSRKIRNTVSKGGRNDGEIFFPRQIVKNGENALMVDKSGRFLEFSASGEYLGVRAEIDAFLANGFCIKDDEALISLSGIVRDSDGQTICDDWLEFIKLDGSSWKKQREEKKSQNGSK
ncbi:unnamed protein product [Caenorhabditis angaria]|uniref:SMP-30/Gluconolactonase/LRE-like region domain-containing protein n=1 Tax=Caenorhabditis angaria TaxID=860376 RepID=A0A9P1IJU0_9PELO|nr:unnamed protein product [Caenorhabditis angaria]